MYFLISEELVDRDDLGIYEKMALVVLARYANGSKSISREELVEKMGADKMDFGYEYTDIAIKKLIKYGILSISDHQEIEVLKLKEFPESSQKPFDSDRNSLKENSLKEESVEADKKHTKEQKLMKMIEDKALEFSEDRRFNIVDLSIKENILQLEQKKGVPIEDVKSIFSEVCSNSKAKILYNLSEKNVEWLKQAYFFVKEQNDSDVLENLAEFLQKNSYESFIQKEKAKISNEIECEGTSEVSEVAISEVKMPDEGSERSEEKHSGLREDERVLNKFEGPDLNVQKAPDLDFYNGYDLKSIFSNLEKKFEYEGASSESVDGINAVDPSRFNIRATSFHQAKNSYRAYGTSKKPNESVTENQ